MISATPDGYQFIRVEEKYLQWCKPVSSSYFADMNF